MFKHGILLEEELCSNDKDEPVVERVDMDLDLIEMIQKYTSDKLLQNSATASVEA